MELTSSFVVLLQHFAPVFTEPTFRTFGQIATGWILSHRHRYITDIIFSGGHLDDGHGPRVPRSCHCQAGTEPRHRAAWEKHRAPSRHI